MNTKIDYDLDEIRESGSTNRVPHIQITGMGRYLPQNKISSLELDKRIGLLPGNIEKKSGLTFCHFAYPFETTSYTLGLNWQDMETCSILGDGAGVSSAGMILEY